MTRYITILATVGACIGLFATCMNEPKQEAYAGSAACAKCHGQLYDSFHLTAHALASMPATATFIKGSFNRDSNSFSLYDATNMGCWPPANVFSKVRSNAAPAITRIQRTIPAWQLIPNAA